MYSYTAIANYLGIAIAIANYLGIAIAIANYLGIAIATYLATAMHFKNS